MHRDVPRAATARHPLPGCPARQAAGTAARLAGEALCRRPVDDLSGPADGAALVSRNPQRALLWQPPPRDHLSLGVLADPFKGQVENARGLVARRRGSSPLPRPGHLLHGPTPPRPYAGSPNTPTHDRREARCSTECQANRPGMPHPAGPLFLADRAYPGRRRHRPHPAHGSRSSQPAPRSRGRCRDPAVHRFFAGIRGHGGRDSLLKLITREAQQPTRAETAERTHRYARALRKEHASQ